MNNIIISNEALSLAETNSPLTRDEISDTILEYIKQYVIVEDLPMKGSIRFYSARIEQMGLKCFAAYERYSKYIQVTCIAIE